MKTWFVDHLVIRSNLNSYFPGEDIKDRWHYYSDALTAYYFATIIYFREEVRADGKEDLQGFLVRIRNYFSDKKEINWDRFTTEMTFNMDMWDAVRLLLLGRGDEIIKDVIKLPIKVF